MSAIKSILVHLDASPRCEMRLEAAGRLAEQHKAEVKALYCVVPRALQFPFAEGMSAAADGSDGPVDDERRALAQCYSTRPSPVG